MLFKFVHSALDTFAIHLSLALRSTGRINMTPDCQSVGPSVLQINIAAAESAFVILLSVHARVCIQHNAFLSPSLYVGSRGYLSVPSNSAHNFIICEGGCGLVGAAGAGVHPGGKFARPHVTDARTPFCDELSLCRSHRAAVYKLGMRMPPPLSACNIYGGSEIRR